MDKQEDCQYAKQLKYSDVVFECRNTINCKFELKLYAGSKYCMWSLEKEERLSKLEKEVGFTLTPSLPVENKNGR